LVDRMALIVCKSPLLVVNRLAEFLSALRPISPQSSNRSMVVVAK
jgi:hypothetical protein